MTLILTIVIPTVLQVLDKYYNRYYNKEPYHTSILSGQAWVEELLNGHPEWLTVWHVGECFQRANATIAYYFKKMTHIFSAPPFYTSYVKQPNTANLPS
ncbi:hypothetical protein AX14_008057 [Amanita brunnescens Koide BX004]|nr:hypothetical protein AX14_008057 [Amanita brunnescens Koide BX004]